MRLSLLLIAIGVILLITGGIVAVLEALPSSSGASISAGGCIIVFFIPVCFGVGEHHDVLLLVSMVIGAVITLLLLWSVIQASRSRNPASSPP